MVFDTRDMAHRVALSSALCPAISWASSRGMSDPGVEVKLDHWVRREFRKVDVQEGCIVDCATAVAK